MVNVLQRLERRWTTSKLQPRVEITIITVEIAAENLNTKRNKAAQIAVITVLKEILTLQSSLLTW